MNRTAEEIYQELLVTRCRRRDLAAWDELIRQWNDRLLYYLRRLISHEQDATNALQEVWLHAFRGIGSLQNDSRLAPWLYTIVRRTAMNQLRRDYACREESFGIEVPDESDDASDEGLRLENAEFVHFGLGKLALPEREVLTLFFLEDLTIQEIADVLGIPPGTVKSRLHRARRELRRVLETAGQSHEQ